MIRAAVQTVLDCYPRIFFACHVRHVRDQSSKRLISSHQASVLDHLDPIEPTHLHELAGHMGITPSSMSLMVDRLERHGYVRRSRDSLDARRVNLRLTRSGLRIKRRQKVLDPRRVELMLRRMPEQDREVAMTGLRILARAAGEMMASGKSHDARKQG